LSNNELEVAVPKLEAAMGLEKGQLIACSSVSGEGMCVYVRERERVRLCADHLRLDLYGWELPIMFTFKCTHTNTQRHTYTHTCMHAYLLDTSIHAIYLHSAYTNMHKYLLAYIHAYVKLLHTCIRILSTHINTCIHILLHAVIHILNTYFMRFIHACIHTNR